MRRFLLAFTATAVTGIVVGMAIILRDLSILNRKIDSVYARNDYLHEELINENVSLWMFFEDICDSRTMIDVQEAKDSLCARECVFDMNEDSDQLF